MSSQKNAIVDILCEFVEILIHNVLFVKQLYPETIYEMKRKYGIAVYKSIHPEINEYINECLKAVRFHALNHQLKRIFICFHTDNKVTEKYIFDVLDLKNNFESDTFLVDLEQSMRNSILKLHASQAYLTDLSNDYTFSIRLETTACSNLEFNQEPRYEVIFHILRIRYFTLA